MSKLYYATAMKANAALGNMGDWQGRHNAAMDAPRAGFESAVVTMLRGWLEYAQTHQERYESPIGEDGVIGVAWAETGKAIHSLLDGETGRMDRGTLSTLIHGTMRDNGIDEEW